MAIRRTRIRGDDILDATIAATDIADGAVSTTKIADANITSAKLATDSVTTSKIVAGTITGAKLATKTVTQDKVNQFVQKGSADPGTVGYGISFAAAPMVQVTKLVSYSEATYPTYVTSVTTGSVVLKGSPSGYVSWIALGSQ